MNRFPIWKGNRIGRYDDRLILRSVIFFALIITALSVFMIRLTEGNILLRIFPSLPDRGFMSAGSVLSMEKWQHDRHPQPPGNVADAAGKPMV